MSLSTTRLMYFNNISWYLLTCVCSYYCQMKNSPQQDWSRLHRCKRTTQLTIFLLNHEPFYASFVITYVENLVVFCFCHCQLYKHPKLRRLSTIKIYRICKEGDVCLHSGIERYISTDCFSSWCTVLCSNGCLSIIWVTISFLKLSS